MHFCEYQTHGPELWNHIKIGNILQSAMPRAKEEDDERTRVFRFICVCACAYIYYKPTKCLWWFIDV